MVAGVWPERTVLGPWSWGLVSGNTPFDYRSEGAIAGMAFRYNSSTIHSITFMTRLVDGSIRPSPPFGTPCSSDLTHEIIFTVGEYITGIDILLSSSGNFFLARLRVYTNKKKYFLDGDDDNDITKPIIFIPTGGVVVGFFGSSLGIPSDDVTKFGIYKFGIYTIPYDKVTSFERYNKCMSIGPFGGPEDQGQLWTYKPQDGQISEIVIRYGSVIDSVVLKGKTSDGSVAFSQRFGGNGGNRTNKLSFGPGEYIIGIEVMLGNYQGQIVVYNLCICTNVTSYGPFGTTSGTQLSIPTRDGRVVGFFGRSGTYLNAIGVYTVPIALNTGLFQENKDCDRIRLSQNQHYFVVGKTWDECIIIGPWGGSEGKVWAYRPTEFITKIEIQYGDCIDSLTFHMTAKDGTVTKSRRFGGSGGYETEEVIIDSGEFITGVDIMVGEYDGQSVITLLSFRTNITTYGPFGTDSGSKISIPIQDGSVVGFYGRYGKFLNSIGIFAVVK